MEGDGETAGVESFDAPAGFGSSQAIHFAAVIGLLTAHTGHVHSVPLAGGLGFNPAAAQSKPLLTLGRGEEAIGVGALAGFGVEVPEIALGASHTTHLSALAGLLHAQVSQTHSAGIPRLDAAEEGAGGFMPAAAQSKLFPDVAEMGGDGPFEDGADRIAANRSNLGNSETGSDLTAVFAFIWAAVGPWAASSRVEAS